MSEIERDENGWPVPDADGWYGPTSAGYSYRRISVDEIQFRRPDGSTGTYVKDGNAIVDLLLPPYVPTYDEITLSNGERYVWMPDALADGPYRWCGGGDGFRWVTPDGVTAMAMTDLFVERHGRKPEGPADE